MTDQPTDQRVETDNDRDPEEIALEELVRTFYFTYLSDDVIVAQLANGAAVHGWIRPDEYVDDALREILVALARRDVVSAAPAIRALYTLRGYIDHDFIPAHAWPSREDIDQLVYWRNDQ